MIKPHAQMMKWTKTKLNKIWKDCYGRNTYKSYFLSRDVNMYYFHF